MSIQRERFDIDSLSDERLKFEYKNLLLRANETIDSLKNAYAKENNTLDISAFYFHSKYLRAYSTKKDNKYLLGISIVTAPLLKIYFQKLLSYSYVLPELQSEKVALNYEVPLSLEFVNKDLADKPNIKLTKSRFNLSNIISNLCVEFILFHEIGHIVCGHVEGVSKIWNEKLIAESYDTKKRKKFLRISWEYEADVIACMLIVQRINALADLSLKTPYLKEIFSFCNDEKELRERLISLFNVALFSLFVYMNRLSLRLGEFTYHPPPLVRVNYAKDFIARRAERDWGIDIKRVERFQDEYLDQFLIALEEEDFIDYKDLKNDFEDKMEKYKNLTQKSFFRYRNVCEKWTWIPQSIWR